jgi:carbonic anhydrase
MPNIVKGVVKFQKSVFPEKEDLFGTLANGQKPETLFITCSDSRISPSLLTQSDPGELFICRNAGNIVPPHMKHTEGMTASIEYAVAVLNVKHIVVCGHSGCGAMIGALNPESTKELPHVSEWLNFSQAAVHVMKEKGKNLSEKDQIDLLIKENVILQLQHLKTHPHVASRLATGKINLHGWIYDIKSGSIDVYDDQFYPVKDFYSEEIEALGCCDNHQAAAG